MKKFTTTEYSNGELAVRNMNEIAKKAYNGTDLISVIEYIDTDATAKAEQEAFDNDRDYFPGELDVVRYAINHDGDIISDLSFEEAEKWLEDYYNECCKED